MEYKQKFNRKKNFKTEWLIIRFSDIEYWFESKNILKVIWLHEK